MIDKDIGPYRIVGRSARAEWARCIAPATRKLNRDVALKVLPGRLRERSRPAGAVSSAKRKSLASLNHPHIAQIYGFEQAGGAPRRW